MDFLTVEEAARILKAHTNTVYKMCRLGQLPAAKMGKEWRIDREKLAESLAAGIPDPDSHRVASDFDPCHQLVILAEKDDVWDFETRLFKENAGGGYLLFKACWWQTPEQVRSVLEQKGVPVAALEGTGEMLIENLAGICQKGGPVAAAQAWRSAAHRALERGFRGVIGCGSPSLDACGTKEELFTFEEALDGFLDGLPVHGACAYYLEGRASWDLDVLVRLMKLHGQVHFRAKQTDVTASIWAK